MMSPQSPEPDRVYKKPDSASLVVLHIINLVAWLTLCFTLIRDWRAMPPHLHFWIIYLAVIFPLLWETMLREKRGLVSLVGLTLAFLGVVFALSLSGFR